jgi:hypothetical protein
MSIYTPPSDNTPIFDDAFFSTGDLPLTYNQAVKKFLRYPIAQGTENLLNVNISGTTALTGRVSQNLYGTSGTITDNNIQFGDTSSLALLTTGINNVAIGYGTLDALTTGNQNVAVGHDAASGLTTGIRNVSIGRESLNKATVVDNSICIGYRAGYNATTTGDNSIAIGNSAGFTTLSNNVIILNASGSTVNSTGINRFFVKPIRNSSTSAQLLYYDSASNEIVYATPILNAGFPMTLALGATDYGTTLNGNATYLGSYVIVTGVASGALATGVVTSVVNVTIPVGVSIINVTETLNISAPAVFTRMRRTLSTVSPGTITTPATGTVALDQTTGPTAAGTYQTIYTFTVINSTGTAIAGAYAVNFTFSSGAMTMQASATTIRIG